MTLSPFHPCNRSGGPTLKILLKHCSKSIKITADINDNFSFYFIANPTGQPFSCEEDKIWSWGKPTLSN